jgi:tetratricopeptide (TPR) repeat protein
VWQWFAHQPRAVQIGLVVVVLAALGAGGYYGQSVLKKRARAKAVGAGWNEYNNAARKADLDGIRAALDRVLAADPNDPTATRYKAILDRGEADPDTPELAVVLLNQHVSKDQLPAAAREAEKVLAHNPKDWLARCAIAHHALQVRGDRAEAERHLNQLPDPEDPAARVGAGGLLYALKLSAVVGRDATPLRRVIVNRLLPFLRSSTAATAPPGAKLQLLECYLEAFGEPGALGELSGYWAVADQLAEGAHADATAAGDVDVLSRLANLGPRMRIALGMLREHDPARFPDDRLVPLAKAVHDRTRSAWQAVRQKAPDRAAAYVGLAVLALQENNPNAAMREIIDGLEKCGDRTELLELLVPLSARMGNDETLLNAARSLLKAAEDAKTDANKWCLFANAALALQRHDDAFIACQRARAVQRDHPVACQIEAWLLIRTGKFVQARESLLALGEPALRTHFGPAQLHGRVMAETLWVLIDDEFNAVLEAQAKLKPKTSLPAVGFLRGVFSADPDAKRAEWVAAQAARVLVNDPDAPLARRLRADALYRLADLAVTPNPKGGAPLWDGNLVSAALRAFDDLRPEEKTEPGALAAVAALQLKGQGNAAAALRTAGGLRAVEGSLNSWQLEVLGAVLTANGKPADAVRVLERAARLPNPTAGLRVALAVAYHRNNQPGDAREEIARAENPRGGDAPTRSAREQAELVAAKQLLLKENP